MSNGFIQIKQNKLDPHTPEKYDTTPVRIRLTRADGSVLEIDEGYRVLKHHLVLRLNGVLYIARGVDAKGVHLYRELPILDLDEPGVTISAEAVRRCRAARAEWREARGAEPSTQRMYISASQRLLKAIDNRAIAESIVMAEIEK